MMEKKVVLIISEDSGQINVENVMDWITSFGHLVVRINGDEFESSTSKLSLKFGGGSLKISLNGKELLNKYFSVWYRRWSTRQELNFLISTLEKQKSSVQFAIDIVGDKAQDLRIVRNIFLNSLTAEKFLTTAEQIEVNKIVVLDKAAKCGLLIPKFLLTTEKQELVSFIEENKSVVVKDIGNNFFHQSNEDLFVNYTHLINEQHLDKYPNYFPISHFQQYIEKKFEIRCFFLRNVFYPMAIFSQSSEKTKIDFRNYDYQKPNRTVAYSLPSDIESKLHLLMETLGLETGSIDLICTPSNSIYFLEVNPVGQYGMVSVPCNYNLDFEIAKYLCN